MLRKVIAISLFALAGCGDKVVVSAPLANCASLIPEGWKQGVAPESIPELGKTDLDAAKAYAQAYVGQTGKLEISNGRTQDAISIMEKCEALANDSRVEK